jgi:hypothetical protein
MINIQEYLFPGYVTEIEIINLVNLYIQINIHWKMVKLFLECKISIDLFDIIILPDII